jgi:hypothetical protein
VTKFIAIIAMNLVALCSAGKVRLGCPTNSPLVFTCPRANVIKLFTTIYKGMSPLEPSLPASPVSIGLSCKSFPDTNTLAYYENL